MQAVLISIQPKWCELIASGKKTIEVRKTRPKINMPFKCYIYMTATKDRCRHWEYITAYQNRKGDILNGSQKVIGEFVCDRITEIVCWDDTKETNIDETLTCLTYEEIEKYGNGKLLYGWHITDVKIYDKPKELGEFKKAGFMTEVQWLYALYPNTHCYYKAWAKRFEINRPPQSWCYVEDLK